MHKPTQGHAFLSLCHLPLYQPFCSCRTFFARHCWKWHHGLNVSQHHHLVNPFPDVAGYIRHETFILWHHFLQWPQEIVLLQQKGRDRGRWVGAPEGAAAWLSLGSTLKTPWLALSGPLLSYAQTGWENSPLWRAVASWVPWLLPAC